MKKMNPIIIALVLFLVLWAANGLKNYYNSFNNDFEWRVGDGSANYGNTIPPKLSHRKVKSTLFEPSARFLQGNNVRKDSGLRPKKNHSANYSNQGNGIRRNRGMRQKRKGNSEYSQQEYSYQEYSNGTVSIHGESQASAQGNNARARAGLRIRVQQQ